MRTLKIHVGPHKTGTTSIQAFLLENARALKARDHEFYAERVSPFRKRGNAWALAHALIRPELATPMRLNGSAKGGLQEDEHLIDAFIKAVQRSDASTILVSSEAFSFLRTAEEKNALRALIDPLFDVVVPIVARRRDDKWRQSWNRQIENMGAADKLTDLPAAERADAEWYFDFDQIIAFWSSFGDVDILDYDRSLEEDGSILPAFLQAAGLTDLGITGDYQLNATLNHESLANRSVSKLKSLVIRRGTARDTDRQPNQAD